MFDGAAVYPDDEFDVDLAAQTLTHRPAFARFDKSGRRRGRRGEPFAYWVRARYPDGRTHVHAIDRDRVEYHRSFSRQPDGPAWSKSYDAMALKSAVLELRRWLPASPVLAAAVAADGVVVDVRELDEDAPALPAGGPVEPDADEQWVAEASAET
jgi:recombinational DNA repair protein RecT